jgi:hypothetical protein
MIPFSFHNKRNVVDAQVWFDTSFAQRNKVHAFWYSVTKHTLLQEKLIQWSRSRWPHGVRHLRLRLIRIQPGAYMSVLCECCVLSDRILCNGPVTRLEESYRVWCVWVWSRNRNNDEALATGAVEPWTKLPDGELCYIDEKPRDLHIP